MRYGKREHIGASLEIGVAKGLPVHMREGIVELSDLYTAPQFRRQGYADALMASVMVEADLAGKMVILTVGEGVIGGADKGALARFYQRHGFVPVQAEPLIMARTPIAARLPMPELLRA